MSIFVWLSFIVFVLIMLALDLGVFHKKNEEVKFKDALRWTIVCIVLALLFNLLIYFLYEYKLYGIGVAPPYTTSGSRAALEFFTGWLVEQTLSLDNIFVIAVIFGYFRIPVQYQHRVLFWGIVGALLLRGVMIGLGAALIQNFSWSHYLFGALLIYAAIKMSRSGDKEFDPEHNVLYRFAKRFYRTSPELDGEKFFTVVDGKRAITPLFLVLVVVESTDVLFAVDSIPAIFAITKDPFIVFTSNIFAILNLRSMYFLLATLMNRFANLERALFWVLIFIGVKMILDAHIEIPVLYSSAVVVGLLLWGVLKPTAPQQQ